MLQQDEIVEGELIDPEDIPLGEVVWVARHLDVAFDGRLDTLQSVPLASAIDTSEFVSAALVFVLHAQNTWPASCSLSLQGFGVELDPCEPDATFVGALIAALSAGKGEAPGMWVADFSLVPSKTMIKLEWSQRLEEATEAQTATISAALVVRRHIPPTYRVR